MPPSTRSPQPIKALLALRDISQAQLARHLDCSIAWVGRLVNGRERPSPELARAISLYLDVPVEDLFADDPDDVIVQFVKRTTTSSNVPELLEDSTSAAAVATILRADK